MSGIAEVLLNLGYRVTGSDAKRNDGDASGSSAWGPRSSPATLPAHVEGAARRRRTRRRCAADNPEVAGGARARHPGDPARGDARRADAAEVRHRDRRRARQDDDDVDDRAVLGARRARSDGGDRRPRCSAFGSNARLGRGEFMVAEADESDGSFLKLSPTIAVVTNIDHEHLENYGDLDDAPAGVRRLRQQGAVLRRGGPVRRRAEHRGR